MDEPVAACSLFLTSFENSCTLSFNQARCQFMEVNITNRGSRVRLISCYAVENPQRFADARCYRDLAAQGFRAGNILLPGQVCPLPGI